MDEGSRTAWAGGRASGIPTTGMILLRAREGLMRGWSAGNDGSMKALRDVLDRSEISDSCPVKAFQLILN